jgi:probable addiction module antidote protein
MTTRYDVAEHLRTPEEMAAYFEACLDEADGDAAFIAKALGDIARAKGMSQVAREAGLSRESLYKALSGERSPDFETVLKVMGALGLELHAKVAQENLAVPAGRAERQGVAKPLVKVPRGAAGARRSARSAQPGSASAVTTQRNSKARRASQLSMSTKRGGGLGSRIREAPRQKQRRPFG